MAEPKSKSKPKSKAALHLARLLGEAPSHRLVLPIKLGAVRLDDDERTAFLVDFRQGFSMVLALPGEHFVKVTVEPLDVETSVVEPPKRPVAPAPVTKPRSKKTVN